MTVNPGLPVTVDRLTQPGDTQHAALAQKVLDLAALLDPRVSNDAATASAWSLVLVTPMTEADALAAVREHYAVEPWPVTPASVNGRVLAMRRARLAVAGEPTPPAELAGSELAEREWFRQWRCAVGDGRTPVEARVRANCALNVAEAPKRVASREGVGA